MVISRARDTSRCSRRCVCGKAGLKRIDEECANEITTALGRFRTRLVRSGPRPVVGSNLTQMKITHAHVIHARQELKLTYVMVE